MKKMQIIGLVCALSAISTASAETVINPVQNGFNITVNYTDDADFNKATLMLLDGTKLVYMSEEAPSNDNRSEITFDTFKVPVTLLTGDYTIQVGANGNITSETFAFKNQIERENKFLAVIRSATKEAAAANLAAAANVVEYKYAEKFTQLAPEFQSQICQSIVNLNMDDRYVEDETAGTNNAEELISEFCTFMDKMYEAVEIMASTAATDVVNKIDNQVLLGFDQTYFNDSTDQTALSRFVYDRTGIAQAIVDFDFETQSPVTGVDIDKLYEVLNGNTLLHIINNNDYTTSETALKHFENNTYMKIDYTYYTNLSSTNKSNVFTNLKTENITDYTKIPGRFLEISKSLAGTGDGSSGSGLTYQKPSGGQISSIGGGVTGGAAPSVTVPPNSSEETISEFKDLGSVMWAKEAISALKNIGAVDGVGNGLYEPESFVTREAYVKMAVIAFDYFDEAAYSDFSDVDKNGWSYPYVSSAYVNELINGISENVFGAKDNITREDTAVIIYRAYSKKCGQVQSDESFADMDEVADYAKEAVSAMKKLGIISGYEDGSFQPKKFVTRAEVAQMIYNAYKLVQQ